MRILHLVPALARGGAETALARLATGPWPSGFDHAIVTFLPNDPAMVAQVTSRGVVVHEVCGSLVNRAVQLWRLFRQLDYDVVQAWMYHANLLSTLARVANRRAVVVWGLRTSNVGRRTASRSSRWAMQVGARISGVVPHAVVACGEVCAAEHGAVGYRRLVVIGNGVPVQAELPSPARRAAARHDLGLSADDFVVARVGRWHPQKDFPTLVQAFARVRAERGAGVLLLAGRGLTRDNDELARLVDEAGLADAVRFLGELDDPEPVYLASDVLCSSSVGEGFPNTLAEAMALGVPVVTTAAGDSAQIVGEAGWVVPVQDPSALAAALVTAEEAGAARRQVLGASAHERVWARYSIRAMVDRYLGLYVRSLGDARRPSGLVRGRRWAMAQVMRFR